MYGLQPRKGDFVKKLFKIMGFCLSLGLILWGLCACSGGADSTELKEGVTLQDIVDEVDSQIGMQMLGDIDDTLLSDMYYMDMNNVETYAGKASLTMTSCDTVVAVKAVPGKIDAVANALKQRQQDLIDQFSKYLPTQYQKAQAGVVIVRGDYAFLVIIGQSEETISEDVQKAEDIINSYFK